jgi:hypothetical protein
VYWRQFAIRVESGNDENADFFVLKCMQRLQTLTSQEGLDDFGVTVDEGEDVILAQYNMQSGTKQNSYVLIKDRGPAWIYSHFVWVSKFPMIQAAYKQKCGTTGYRLPKSTIEQICFVLIDDDLDLDAKEDFDTKNEESS